MYIEITNEGECFSTTMEFINGVYANKTEWAKYNFYPRNGMVGEVVKRTPSAYIIKIKDGIYVPMTKNGIREITHEEYLSKQSNNICDGMNTRQKKINERLDAWNNETGYDFQHLPNMREAFKQDIICNIEKLTCDYKRNIYLPDLERSAVIYATDMCLEYRKKSGRNLAPMTINGISNQVCDVYTELFGEQFTQASRNRCLSMIQGMVTNPTAEDIIDKYYQQVNYRYSWS